MQKMDRIDRYQEKDSPGRVIIINNFDYNRPLSEERNDRLKRMTSDDSTCEEKASELEKVFREHNFRGIKKDGRDDVMVVENYTKAQLQELMKNVKSNDLENDYCFICVIMSYGEPGLITCVPRSIEEQDHFKKKAKAPDNMNIPIADLLEALKGEGCPALVGRPKIFLVQTQPQPTDTVDDLSVCSKEQEDTRNTIPREADFLVHAVCENQDYVVDAWVAGLQECKVEKKQMEINTFLIKCNERVRNEHVKEAITPLSDPCVTSLLTKRMYINYRASSMITDIGTYSSGQGLAIMICNFIHEETEEDKSKYENVHGKEYRKLESIGEGVSKQEWVYKCDKIKPRAGAYRDVENLKAAFGKLGYKVDIHRNQTKMEMEGLLEKASQDYNSYKSFALVISSHGGETETREDDRCVRHDSIKTFDNEYYLVEHIITFFNDRKSTFMTNGVPKLFFIQACRVPSSQNHKTDSVDGTDIPYGIDPGCPKQQARCTSSNILSSTPSKDHATDPNTDEVSNTGTIDNSSNDVHLNVAGIKTTPLTWTNIPCYKDMLFMFASPQGFYALRKSSEGSCFLTELAKEIERNCQGSSQQMNLIQLLINVSYNMSAIKPIPLEVDGKKCKAVLVPSIVHSLVKDVVFMPPV